MDLLGIRGGLIMTKKECEHDWDFRIPYAPETLDETYIHVSAKAYCTICGEERITDYSWCIDEHHTVIEEGDYEAYECDQCGVEMDDEGKFTDNDYEDTHFCSKKCYAQFWGEEE
jgi:hypothetical protein